MLPASPWQRLQALSPVAKAGVVLAGFVTALLLALGLTAIYVILASSPERDASSGMSAFGDALLFLAIFGVLSLAPACVAFVFLRQCRAFRIALWVVAGTACIALVSGVNGFQHWFAPLLIR